MGATDEFAARLNTRVRAMKSRLFERARYEDLLDHPDLSLLVETLLNSSYEEQMAEALTRYRGADAVEDAVSRNLVSTLQLLGKLAAARPECAWTPLGEPTRIFLTRWDLTAAKTLVRCRHHGLGPGEAGPALMPGPHLGVAVMRELAASETVDSLVNGLTFWSPELCAGLAAALPRYRETEVLAVLEEALDRAYFVETVEALAPSTQEDHKQLLHVLRMEIDRINLRTLLTGMHDVVDRESLLPEGTLSQTVLDGIASAPGAAEAMELLGPTPYRELVEGLYRLLVTKRFAPMERMFESFILAYLRREARSRPLSLAVVMHYCWLKSNEAMNLRLIAQGEARHLPRGRIREEMQYA